MVTRSRKQIPDLQRYRPPGIVPLELWDLQIGERILWDAMRVSGFGIVLRHVLLELHRGEGTTRSEGAVPSQIAGFRTVWISGGKANSAEIQHALRKLPFSVYFAGESTFAGIRGGDRLLESLGFRGWVADLGQRQLKVATESEEWIFERDFQSLPIREEDNSLKEKSQRLRLRAFLTGCLRECRRRTIRPPETIVFALPARVGDDGIPEGSSYFGMRGDRTLVADVLHASGLEPERVLLLNDAELAALAAQGDPRIQADTKTLVLTLGFGLGAALLVPCA